MEWLPILKDDQLPEGVKVLVHLRGIPIVLIRKRGEVYALENRCAHMGCPLFDGLLEENFLLCSCHEWAFDIRTGELQEAPEIRVRTFPVRDDRETLWILINRETA